MVKIICNRCGADITGEHGKYGKITIRMHETPDTCSPFKWVFGESGGEHYYGECVGAIVGFINKPIKQEGCMKPTQHRKQPAADEKPTRKRIDYGKIMALRDAGWDNGKVADEMHMSKASVAQAVCKYRKEGIDKGRKGTENLAV